MRPDEDYQLDDLVRDQRRQMWLAAGIVVVAVIYTMLGGKLPDQAAASPTPTGGVAPILSAPR